MKLSFKPSIQWLLVFIPLTLVFEHAGVSPPGVFFSAALAIVPVASMIVHATEQISMRTGDAIGGLLNATFGNAPELIIAIVALRSGLFEMVRASLVGAILANLLLALGVSFLIGGLRNHYQEYNAVSSRLYGSLMFIAAVSLALPGGFSRIIAPEETILREQYLNLGLSVVLLLLYGLYLVFMLRTHPEIFRSTASGEESHGEEPAWSMPRAVGSLVVASVLAAWMSEVLVGAAEGTGRALGMSEAFIGMIFLAIVGGAAESGSAIAMARKNKMDLSVGILMGSCIQIALFVAPVLVLASYLVAPAPLELSFARGESGALFIAVMIGAVVAGEGRSHWYKGVQLITIYVLLALVLYLLPTASP